MGACVSWSHWYCWSPTISISPWFLDQLQWYHVLMLIRLVHSYRNVHVLPLATWSRSIYLGVSKTTHQTRYISSDFVAKLFRWNNSYLLFIATSYCIHFDQIDCIQSNCYRIKKSNQSQHKTDQFSLIYTRKKEKKKIS